MLTAMMTLVIFLSTFSVLTGNTIAQETEYWALIVTSETTGAPNALLKESDYMYHTLHEHYDFDGLYYLHPDNTTQGVNATANLENVRSAITNWLGSVSDAHDVIFIYFNTHGAGYYKTDEHQENYGGRFDNSGEEADNYDEGLVLKVDGTEEYYWDDDLATDLATLSYSKLVLATQSCFGGGLIRDVEGFDRAILTATGENIFAYKDLDGYVDVTDGYCEWSEVFIDALHGEDTYWDDNDGVVHPGAPVDADKNDDRHVSMWEAYLYAKANDNATDQSLIDYLYQEYGDPPFHSWDVAETPRLSNKLPAISIAFPKKCVHLTVHAEDEFGDALSSGDVYIDDALSGYTGSVFHVSIGQHETFVNDFWEAGETGYRYGFEQWDDESAANPRNLTIEEDVVLTAIFNKRWCPADVDGDGDVDRYDYGEFSDAYLTTRGDLRWDSRCDFDADGDVDYDDFNIFAANYGNVYW
jgi:hypothetical protein